MAKMKSYYHDLLGMNAKTELLDRRAGMRQLISQNIDKDLVLYDGRVFTQEAFSMFSATMRFEPIIAFVDAVTAGSLFDEIITEQDILDGFELDSGRGFDS